MTGNLFKADGYREGRIFTRDGAVGGRYWKIKKIAQRAIHECVRAADETFVVAPEFQAIKQGGPYAGIEDAEDRCTIMLISHALHRAIGHMTIVI